MSSELFLDPTGRRRSPPAMPGHNAGHAPRNKDQVYPADPPTVDEIVAVMRQAPADRHGLGLRALIVVLWRGGPRIQEALSLIESDLDPRRGSILIRRGKGNRRREVGMHAWAWSDHVAPWLADRVELPAGALFCVIDGPTRGRPWSATAARGELRRYASAAGVRRRFAPHQLRHAHAVELARGGVPLPVIQRQLGHSYVSTTSVYLHGIDLEEIIGTIHARRAPTMHASGGLELGPRPDSAASRDCRGKPLLAGVVGAAQDRQPVAGCWLCPRAAAMSSNPGLSWWLLRANSGHRSRTRRGCSWVLGACRPTG
jgi:integrase-like protein